MLNSILGLGVPYPPDVNLVAPQKALVNFKGARLKREELLPWPFPIVQNTHVTLMYVFAKSQHWSCS